MWEGTERTREHQSSHSPFFPISKGRQQTKRTLPVRAAQGLGALGWEQE